MLREGVVLGNFVKQEGFQASFSVGVGTCGLLIGGLGATNLMQQTFLVENDPSTLGKFVLEAWKIINKQTKKQTTEYKEMLPVS